MHPVQAREGIRGAEMRHQEQLAQAELNYLVGAQRRTARPNMTVMRLVAQPLRLAAGLLIAVLAVNSV